jgi:hypothetical protein
MLQELEFQRARLEKLLQQNEVMRCQLEITTGSVIKVGLIFFKGQTENFITV